MVCKQRKFALKQDSLALERFIEQFVVNADLTGILKHDTLHVFHLDVVAWTITLSELHVRCAVVRQHRIYPIIETEIKKNSRIERK